jgi:hypothetical protein
VTLCGPGTYQPTRAKKTQAIRYYLDLIDHITPTDEALRRACLWHGDLHTENIFVDPLHPTEVTSIIDWQSTEIAPLFVQARQPYFLDYEGVQLPGVERPELPSDYEQFPDEGKVRANTLYSRQALRALYRTLMAGTAPEVWKCWQFQEAASPSSFDLLSLARSLLVDGEATYTAAILELLESSSSTGPPPAAAAAVGLAANNSDNIRTLESSSSSEKDTVMADAEGALRGMYAMQDVRDSLEDLFPERGLVRSEQYELAKAALRRCKEQFIERVARTDEEKAVWRESWPFDD